ncbi:hypothetical protein BASA81_001729 [Batrachochytrium salamandrivorans]|nr:hypothetical protein BASA81_001729 [Batrachochytrium salamandrivorans]
MIHVLGKQDFDARLASVAAGTVVVVDWFAPWCGPCRQIAPHFEQLALKYSTCLFLSVDTENPANENLRPTPPLKAFPTFEIFVHAVGNAYYQRFEGANLKRVEDCVLQALEGENPVKVVFKERGRLDFAQRFKPQANLDELTQSKRKRQGDSGSGEVWVMNKRVLNSTIKLGWTLEELDFDVNGGENVIRVLPKAGQLTVRMRLVGSESGADCHVCQFGPFATCSAVLREAQQFTQSNKPKVIYLGKMLEDMDNVLVSSVLQDQATVLCMPFGGVYTPVILSKPATASLYIDEDEDIYALEKEVAAKPAPVIVKPVAAVVPKLVATVASKPVATVSPTPVATLIYPNSANLSPLLLRAEKLYGTGKHPTTANVDDDGQALLKSYLVKQ